MMIASEVKCAVLVTNKLLYIIISQLMKLFCDLETASIQTLHSQYIRHHSFAGETLTFFCLRKYHETECGMLSPVIRLEPNVPNMDFCLQICAGITCADLFKTGLLYLYVYQTQRKDRNINATSAQEPRMPRTPPGAISSTLARML